MTLVVAVILLSSKTRHAKDLRIDSIPALSYGFDSLANNLSPFKVVVTKTWLLRGRLPKRVDMDSIK